MSNNPFRQSRDGSGNGMANATTATHNPGVIGSEGKSKDASLKNGVTLGDEGQGRYLALNGASQLRQSTGAQSQAFSNPFTVQPPIGQALPASGHNGHHYPNSDALAHQSGQNQVPPFEMGDSFRYQPGLDHGLPEVVTASSAQRNGVYDDSLPEIYDESLPEIYDESLPEVVSVSTHSSSTQRNRNHDESLPELVQNPHLHHNAPEVLVQPRHAHVPSFSQVRQESLALPRPTYVRALSSHIAESEAPPMTATDAHAEIVRRLGKAEKTVKSLKRRGSNESLSSLISYSIRRPSISAKPESGYSLDALAAVLEDVAQDGNLALVQAVIGLGANPNFRSVNRLKNRRHDALNKATAAGHVEIIDYLLRQGATYKFGESQQKDAFTPIDYKLLEVAYSGYSDVARYLISNQGANPFIEQWPREYHDAIRTVYRRVVPAKVHQRTVLDAISRMGDPAQDTPLLKTIMADPNFDPSAISTRIYIDTPYTGDDSRMLQTTTNYSALAAFAKTGWASAVEVMLARNPDPAAYQRPDTTTTEEGQIPSANIQRYIYPTNALTKDTWTYLPSDALRILHLLVNHAFDVSTPQRTPDDSAPRTPLSRAILANAAPAVEVLLAAHPDLVKTDISFRLLLPDGEEREYIAQPLAAAIIQGSLDAARVILRSGASPADPAFSYRNVVCFAAGHGGSTGVNLLEEMVGMAPELLGQALEVAISKARFRAVEILLASPVAGPQLATLALWDAVLGCKDAGANEQATERYLRVIDLLAAESRSLMRPSREAVQSAIEQGNVVGVEKLIALEVIDGAMNGVGDGQER
jgi:ankyrin repeat protein